MKLVIDVGENSEGMYELLNSFKKCVDKGAPAVLSPVHIQSTEIIE